MHITDWDKTRSVVTSIVPFDFLVNNAGVGIQKQFVDVAKSEIDTAFDVNLKAVFNLSQVAVKGMMKGGRGGSIVNITSIVAFRPFNEVVLFFFFLIQFNVPFKIISLIETSQSIGAAKREYPGKTTWHTRKQNLSCLICGQCGARTYTRHSGEMIE